MLRLAIFDVDGTLLDTTEFIYQAYEHTLAAQGLKVVPRERMAKVMGKPLEICYETFAPGADNAGLCNAHQTWQTKNLHLSRPFSNTVRTLTGLRDAGVAMGALTTRSRRTSLNTLHKAGISHFFDLVISGEDVSNKKPDPEGIHRALDRLELKPTQAVMVGDTDVDVQTGKNAGTKTIGVTYGMHGTRIAGSNPDHVVDDIIDILPLVTEPATA